jgi:hypothetical protein
MRKETFSRLVENVQNDDALTQIPFVVRNPATGRWQVLLGNHRVMAAVEAGLDAIPVLVTDDALTHDQKRGIQLSHNALVGEDDPAVLKQIYESIDQIDWKQYAGLDDKMLELLAKIPSGSSIFI